MRRKLHTLRVEAPNRKTRRASGDWRLCILASTRSVAKNNAVVWDELNDQGNLHNQLHLSGVGGGTHTSSVLIVEWGFEAFVH